MQKNNKKENNKEFEQLSNKSKSIVNRLSLLGTVALSIVSSAVAIGGVSKEENAVSKYDFGDLPLLVTPEDNKVYNKHRDMTLVLTKQFEYELLSEVNVVDRYYFIVALKQAVEDFNSLSSYKITLKAETNTFSKYNIEQKNGNSDFEINFTIEDVADLEEAALTNVTALGSGEITSLSLSIKLEAISRRFAEFLSREKMYAVENSYAYSVLVHEFGHFIGLNDIYEKNEDAPTIMYGITDGDIRTYTSYDKENIAKISEIVLGNSKTKYDIENANSQQNLNFTNSLFVNASKSKEEQIEK